VITYLRITQVSIIAVEYVVVFQLKTLLVSVPIQLSLLHNSEYQTSSFQFLTLLLLSNFQGRPFPKSTHLFASIVLSLIHRPYFKVELHTDLRHALFLSLPSRTFIEFLV